MALVWLGWKLSDLRRLRGESIGAERGENGCSEDSMRYISGGADEVPARLRGWVSRYRNDAESVARQISRVLKPVGTGLVVVGNSNVRGWAIDNAAIYTDALIRNGVSVTSEAKRPIPANRRYLPTSAGSALASRMRSEVVLRLAKN